MRTFTNALAWERRVLGWEPYEKTTVLLKDFSDYGNASATPLPRNTLRFDIAPVSYAFETFSASERLYSIMNHELVHVATTDKTVFKDAQGHTISNADFFAALATTHEVRVEGTYDAATNTISALVAQLHE